MITRAPPGGADLMKPFPLLTRHRPIAACYYQSPCTRMAPARAAFLLRAASFFFPLARPAGRGDKTPTRNATPLWFGGPSTSADVALCAFSLHSSSRQAARDAGPSSWVRVWLAYRAARCDFPSHISTSCLIDLCALSAFSNL